MHWVLDVAMDEDLNRSRVGNSAQNLALMRKLVLNLLRLEKGSKGGVKARQKRAPLGSRISAAGPLSRIGKKIQSSFRSSFDKRSVAVTMGYQNISPIIFKAHAPKSTPRQG